MELDNEVLVDDSEVPDCEWDEDDIIHKDRMADRFEKEIKPRLKLLHSFHKEMTSYTFLPSREETIRLFGEALQIAFTNAILNDNLGVVRGLLSAKDQDEVEKSLNLLGFEGIKEDSYLNLNFKEVLACWFTDKPKACRALLSLLYSSSIPNVESITAQ
ncbi:hypothetical protein [Endozoicomonas sp. Mp262]|uniref:hypothetical protein n=1 Tax=Endozoicomonas sp. Mp262 TaxID=2919499 RepID=UPI0021D98A6B